ncbi:MAG: pilus assembly protein TadG-related protein, partial [Planctomycetaceae bacterium]
MRHVLRNAPHAQPHSRQGTVLIVTAIGAAAMVGMLLLIVETGMVMDTRRKAQNAIDSAALAAAQALVRQMSSSSAATDAQQFIQQYNNVTGGTVTLNMPPATGPYAGRYGYCEAVIQMHSANTLFSSFARTSAPTFNARAVAGYRQVSSPEMIIALDKRYSPGLNCVGN